MTTSESLVLYVFCCSFFLSCVCVLCKCGTCEETVGRDVLRGLVKILLVYLPRSMSKAKIRVSI